jgi:PBP1b-binding outer membrane lipoprotein LpoB
MKKFAILSLFLASSFLLNGCNSPSPKQEAKEKFSIGKISGKKKKCPGSNILSLSSVSEKCPCSSKPKPKG